MQYNDQISLPNGVPRQEFSQIVNFLTVLSQPKDGLTNVLNTITQFFGYSGASLWFVNKDYSMSNPSGYNVPTALLDRYSKEYYEYDRLYPKHLGRRTLQDITLMVCDQFVDRTLSTPYTDALNFYKLHHEHALLLRDENEQIFASIALFKSVEQPSSGLLRAEYLNYLAPYIAVELRKIRKYSIENQVYTGLSSTLSRFEQGVILFLWGSAKPQIIFSNTRARQYSEELIPYKSKYRDSVFEFAKYLMQNYFSHLPELAELTLNLVGDDRSQFSVRMFQVNKNTGMYSLIIEKLPEATSIPVPQAEAMDKFNELSVREQTITSLVMKGLTNREISEQLCISISTVKTHLQHIFEKVQVPNRTSLMAKFNNTKLPLDI